MWAKLAVLSSLSNHDASVTNGEMLNLVAGDAELYLRGATLYRSNA
jgi:hypothetical protein